MFFLVFFCCYFATEHQPPLVLKPILTFPKGKDKLLCFVKDFSKSIQPMNFSPLSFSPVGEMLVTPNCQRQVDAGYSVTVIDWWMQVSLAL